MKVRRCSLAGAGCPPYSPVFGPGLIEGKYPRSLCLTTLSYSPVFGPGLIEGSYTRQGVMTLMGSYSPVFGPGLIEGAGAASSRTRFPPIPRSSDRASLKEVKAEYDIAVLLLFPGLRTGPH